MTTHPESDLPDASGAIRAMRRDHFNVLFAKLRVQPVPVVGAITSQVLRPGLNFAKLKTQLPQPDFMMICHTGADRERQTVTSGDRHEFHDFSMCAGHDLSATTLGRRKRGIYEAFRLVRCPNRRAPCSPIRSVRCAALRSSTAAEWAEAWFLVPVVLRQRVPLRTGIDSRQ